MERDKYWDSLKFVLIFLVVYGHIVAHYLGKSHFNMAIYNEIYFFHMPLFIFISGRFSHIRNKQKYRKSIVLLIETYVVFQIIRTFVSVVFENSNFTLECLTKPGWTLWYLVVLIYWRLILYSIHGKCLEWVHQHPKKVIVASFCISIFAGFIPFNPLAIQESMSFLPFFVMGYFSVDYNIKEIINKIHIFYPLLFLCVIFVILYFLNTNFDYVHHCSFTYWTDDIAHTVMRLGLRCLFFPVAIFLSLSVMRLVPSNSVIVKWGSATMFIFIFHSFALREVLFPLTVGNAILQHPIMLFVHAVIVTICMIILSRSKFLNTLMNPISKNPCFNNLFHMV